MGPGILAALHPSEVLLGGTGVWLISPCLGLKSPFLTHDCSYMLFLMSPARSRQLPPAPKRGDIGPGVSLSVSGLRSSPTHCPHSYLLPGALVRVMDG